MNTTESMTLSAESGAAPSPRLLKLKRILVPVDFSPMSLKALEYALPLAERFGASIFLVHVVDSTSPTGGLRDLPWPVSDDERTGPARAKLCELARRQIRQTLPTYPYVFAGKPYEQIILFAKVRNVDLIVIATHGNTGVRRALLGSTAERVVRHAGCPVLVVRETEREFVAQPVTERNHYENQTCY